MAKYLTYKNLLFGILVLAFLLRFWGVWDQDLFGDEAADAFRSIGYVDYLGTSFQTQPVDWYKYQLLPWWTKLSFHDLPPFGILIMNFFFRVFGDSLLVARLPAIIAGILSAYFLYLIVKKLFSAEGGSATGGKDETLALFSALFFAVNSALVWVFRLSMLEPLLLFFILLNIYFFFKFLENRRFWWVFGLTFGLVALTKYTGIFLVPVYLSRLFMLRGTAMLRRETTDPAGAWSPRSGVRLGRRSGLSPLERENRGSHGSMAVPLFLAFGLALLMFSPVIIYNFYLYKATGHFDLQFAYLLGQETPEWTGSVGKIQAPFSEIWKNLTLQKWDDETNSIFPVGYYGISAMIFVLGGLIYSIFSFIRRPALRSGLLFFWLYLLFVTLLLMKIGSAHRFLTLFGPAFAVFAGFFLNFLWNAGKELKWSYLLKGLAIIFIILEIIHSINNNFVKMPDYGMAKLDHYFEEEFVGKESAVIPESDNPHLNNLTYKFALRKSKAADREFRMIVYNDNIALPTLEWIFYRRFFYHSAPALFVENFNKAIQVQGLDYFRNFQIYFVQSTENTILNPFKKDKTAALEFENYLLSKGLRPEKIIYGKGGVPMFRVYKFTTLAL